jgi:hypothetical protein
VRDAAPSVFYNHCSDLMMCGGHHVEPQQFWVPLISSHTPPPQEVRYQEGKEAVTPEGHSEFSKDRWSAGGHRCGQGGLRKRKSKKHTAQSYLAIAITPIGSLPSPLFASQTS